MPKPKPTSNVSSRTRPSCDLCGLPLGRQRVEARLADRSYAFCCIGCRHVFAILLEAAGSADPEAFRRSDLYRQCQANGIIPRTEADLAEQAGASAAPGSPSAEPADGRVRTSFEPLTLALKVTNMWCPACAWLIETVVARLPGVESARCNFLTDQLQVDYDPAATGPPQVMARLAHFGYTAVPPEQTRDQTLRRREWVRFGVAAFLSMNVMMLSAALDFGFFTVLPAESVASISWPLAVMAAAVLGYGGSPLMLRAWRGLTQAAFSMETLVAVGALSAFGLSLVNLVAGSIHLYFDTACMLVTLVLLGKILERRAKDQVLEGLEGFLALAPAKVRRVSNAFPAGRFEAADRLVAGDLFIVAAGEIVAADGVIVSGGGAADESAITGEPLPIAVKPGDAVRSGSRVQHGSLTVCAGKVGDDSTLGQMMAVVETTLARKTPGETRTDRILQWFVPAVLALAAGTGAGLWLFGRGFDEALVRAVTVLVISCPCALGVAIPLARVVGVGMAVGNGMLVRNFSAFEQVQRARTIVLDKTGTVTRGTWRLLDVIPLGRLTAEQVLSLAAGLEQAATHPIAEEIRGETRRRHLRPERVAGLSAEENGICGSWQGLPVKIGSARFLAPEFAGQEDQVGPLLHRHAGCSFVYLSFDGRPEALFAFGDELRPGANETVAALKREGYRLALVSGDGAETTRSVGLRLGIRESHGGLLPGDKAAYVAGLQKQGQPVVVVGDGINDAPALAQADLSLAVFGGGSLGKDVADVTLMRADPAQIPEFLAFAGSVNRTIRRNLALTFLYNAISIPVAMSGLLSPLVAVCAMLLSSLSVIGNTMRLVRERPSGRPALPR
jgi:heavy metal translocating P-type ATPase